MATANQKARKAACDWAKKIAADNTFHYGRSSWGHTSGCYFCGTQGTKKKKAPKSQKGEVAKTYCCNPFVTASYHHGAGAPSVDCRYKAKRLGLAGDSNKPLKNTKEWKKIKKPKKVTDLQYGDILLTPTHIMLYVGDGKVSHAKHHDNGVKGKYWNESITTEKIPSKQWSRTTKIYRYIGKGKFKDDVKYKVNTLRSDLNVRKTSDPTSAIIGSLKKGTVIDVDKTENGMSHCSAGWVASRYLTKV